jgi:hypothetical protein
MAAVEESAAFEGGRWADPSLLRFAVSLDIPGDSCVCQTEIRLDI